MVSQQESAASTPRKEGPDEPIKKEARYGPSRVLMFASAERNGTDFDSFIFMAAPTLRSSNSLCSDSNATFPVANRNCDVEFCLRVPWRDQMSILRL